MKKFIKLFAISCIFAASLLTIATAQSFKATVLGQVTDANGAAVPNATVAITQVSTNRSQTVQTDQDGNYSITQLDPGTYTLRVEAANFKTLIQKDLVLETETNRRVSLVLEAGNISEQVTVTDETPVMNTVTSEKAEVITPRQIQDLPLNGRNYEDLALLVPGIYPRPSDDDQGEGVSSAGSRTDATNFILDGATNRSDRNGDVAITASADAIREFKVSTSSYSAEYGKVAGAQINVVSKSGGNRFSGTLFEYLRNDAFDANDFFASEDTPKTLRKHQFGGTFGGPLPFLHFGEGGPVIDSGRDKTFFFVSYERTLETRSRSAQSTAPNADWLIGDFRNAGITIRCLSRNNTTQAVTKVTCPTPNVIPMNDITSGNSTILGINPISRQMLEFLPAANVPGSLSQYRVTLPREANNHQFLMKFDRKVNDKNNFYFRYNKENEDGTDPFPSSRNFYPGFGRTRGTNSSSWTFGDSHIFSDRIINEFRLGYLNEHSETLGENSDQDWVETFGISGLPTSHTPSLQGWPAIRIDGFSEFGDRPNDPFVYTFKNLQIYDAVSATFGNHSLKFGIDFLRPEYIEADVRNVRGDFRFRGRNTNTSNSTRSGAGAFADFLYGLPDSTQRQIGADPAVLTGWQYSFFIQDNWSVTPWLTLNLGLRYDLAAQLHERDNRLSNFIPELGISVCAGGEFIDPELGVVCRSADELGLPGSLVRADKNNFAPRFGFALRPFDNDKTVIRGGAGIFYSLETINPARQQLALSYPYLFREAYSRLSSNLTLLSFQNPFPAGRGGLDGLTEPSGIPIDSKIPEVYQYNLTLEREIIKDLAFEIGYVGTQARHLGMRYNLNAPVPIGVNPDGTLRTQRAFPSLGDIQYQVQAVNSSYHAMQASVRRRQRNGLSMLISYTFSKAMDMNSSTNNSTTGSQRNPQDIRNWRAEYALSDFHRAHQLSASVIWELPFGKNLQGLSRTFLGGWQLNGITTYTSGRPFTPQFSAPDVTQQRPDLIGDPYQNIPEGFMFNPYAFATPVAASGDLYGNAGRNILIGPRYSRTDVSLLKNFRFNENMRLQLRWEVFNVFNQTNFKLPTFLLPDVLGPIEQLRSTTNVGRPTELSTPMREMQLAARFIF